MNAWPLALLLLATACDLPRDSEGTADWVRTEGRFHVGLIHGDATAEPRWRAYLTRVEAASGARATVERGAAEPLLARLEEGELDLVLGTMAPASPWEKQVHFLPALEERVSRETYVRLVPMAMHGENRWIALLDREARAAADGR